MAPRKGKKEQISYFEALDVLFGVSLKVRHRGPKQHPFLTSFFCFKKPGVWKNRPRSNPSVDKKDYYLPGLKYLKQPFFLFDQINFFLKSF